MRRLAAWLLPCLLAGCMPYQADRQSVGTLAQNDQAVLLVKVGPVALSDVESTNVFGGKRQVASILIAAYNPPTMPGGRIATYPVITFWPGQFPIPNNWPGGFLTKTVPSGDYFIKGLYRLKRSTCFNEGSLAFHVAPGQAVYLGQLNAETYLTRIGDRAEADAITRLHTKSGPLGIGSFYADNGALDRSDQGWLAPAPPDTAEAQTFLQTSFGTDTPVITPAFQPVTWATAPGPTLHTDGCGTSPAFIKSAVLKLEAASPAGLTLTFGTPPGDPRPNLPRLTFSPASNGAYAWQADNTTTLLDGACKIVPPADFLRAAQDTSHANISFTTYQTEDDTAWAPPEAHLFHPKTSDQTSCSYPETLGPPTGGGVIFVPQFHFHK